MFGEHLGDEGDEDEEEGLERLHLRVCALRTNVHAAAAAAAGRYISDLR